MTGSAPLQLPQTYGPSADGVTPVDVVVLSKDDVLFDAVTRAVGHQHPIWTVRTAEDAVEMLVRGSCGVLVVDLASVVFQPDRMVRNVVEQFPDVVVCVAGGREDEFVMAPLISDGVVYRFMHRPLSPKRAGMFLHAAIRNHLDKREGVGRRRLQPADVERLPSRLGPFKWIGVAVGVALFVMLLSIFIDDEPAAPLGTATANVPRPAASPPAIQPIVRAPPRVAPAPVEVAPAAPAVVTPSPEPAPVATTTPASAPAAPVVPAAALPPGAPLLAAAQAAFDANRLDLPAGACALDLYHALLSTDPSNAEARAGYSRTIDRMLINARIALNQGNATEARRLVDRAIDADPKRETSLLLARQIDAVLAPPKPAPAPVPKPSPSAASLANAPTTIAPRRALPPDAGPVTKIAPPALPPAPPPAPIVVRPDPLAARIINPQDPNPVQRPRIPAHAVPQLPIAGYVKPSAAVSSNARAEGTIPPASPAPPAGPTMPAGAFEKLEVHDPVYPLAALRSHTQGWVQLEFTITTSGTVQDIAVIEAEPKGVFDQSATDALSRWRFRPRYVNGQPIAQRSTITLHYNVEG